MYLPKENQLNSMKLKQTIWVAMQVHLAVSDTMRNLASKLLLTCCQSTETATELSSSAIGSPPNSYQLLVSSIQRE
jgi:hypothetical protein